MYIIHHLLQGKDSYSDQLACNLYMADLNLNLNLLRISYLYFVSAWLRYIDDNLYPSSIYY